MTENENLEQNIDLDENINLIFYVLFLIIIIHR